MLYAHSTAVTADTVCGDNATLFAINNIPDYPRREVIAVECATGPLVRTSAAQIGKQGDRAYVLVEAGKKGSEELVAKTKGLFADAPNVSGELKHVDDPFAHSLVQEVSADVFEMANSSVKMTIKDGRITSLKDVALKCVEV